MCDLNRRIAVFALGIAALCFAGCSSSPNGETTDAGTSGDTVESEDTGVADTGTPDTGTDTGTEQDTGPPPPLKTFTYVEETPNCSMNCKNGVRVNILNDRIVEIEDRNEKETLSESDTNDLRENYLTQEVADKMENGWECGSETKHNGSLQLFKSFPGDADFDDSEDIQNVAGCIPDSSTQPDAELVHKLVDKLVALRGKYFK